MKSIDKETFKQISFRLGKGIIISLFITILLIFVFSIILTFTDVPESTANSVIIIISMISILIGSSLCTIKIKKNGIINGGFVGIIYIFLLYILSSLVYGKFNLNIASILMMGLSIISGIIGGIIGVNL